MEASGDSPLSAEVWVELRELGSDFVSQFIQAYITESDKHIPSMGEALKAKESEALFKAAHTMKGGSGNVGAMHLSSICQKLQMAAREARWEECAELVPQVEAEHVRVVEALRAESQGD